MTGSTSDTRFSGSVPKAVDAKMQAHVVAAQWTNG